jgi:Uma2 family endonuclease
MIALSAGTQEYWVVDESARTVEVSRPDGVHVYRAGHAIPIRVLEASLQVDEIFA